MKKTVASLVLVSLILSVTACGAKTQKVTPRSITTTEANIPASKIEKKDTQITSDTTLIDETEGPQKIVNHTQRPKNQNDISIKLVPETKSADVEQKLTYVNNTDSILNDMYFNLIPNAFTKSEGGIEMKKITINGQEVTLKKVKDTVYSVDLPSPLEKGKNVTIDMSYTIKIPKIADRFGYNGNTYNLGNALITPAMYENGQWLVQPYVNIGDAFYTEIADYHVSIQAPEGYQVAASGTKIDGVYQAENMRDFACVISSDLDLLCEEHEDIALNVFYPKKCPSAGRHVMDIAKKALSLFNETLGKYPYDTLSMALIDMPGNIGGMEYPGLIMMTVHEDMESIFDLYNGKISVQDFLMKQKEAEGTDGDNEKIADIESSGETMTDEQIKGAFVYEVDSITKSTVHEIAHQWFYGIVGNDEVRYPWIDEGFCRFMEGYYSDKYSEGDKYTFPLYDHFDATDKSVYGEKDDLDQGEYRSVDLNKSLYDFKNNAEDYGEIYYKAAAMIYHMYKRMGNDAFVEALKEYINKFAYKEVTPEEFKEFWASKGDFKEHLEIYLPSKK